MPAGRHALQMLEAADEQTGAVSHRLRVYRFGDPVLGSAGSLEAMVLRETLKRDPERQRDQPFGLAEAFLLLLAPLPPVLPPLLLPLLAALALLELPLAGLSDEPPFAAVSIRAESRDLIRAALLRWILCFAAALSALLATVRNASRA